MPNDPEEVLLSLGVSATTGKPLNDLSDEAVRAEVGQPQEPGPVEKAATARTEAAAGATFGVAEGIDGNDLTQVGWGILFAPGMDQKIKDALQPLIDHRKGQGAEPHVVYDKDGYRVGETAIDWLKRRNSRLDVVDPSHGIPFYLLIVAPPDVIPFEFQYTLDLYWAVGRLWFDTPDEFRRYADSVIGYEKAAKVSRTRQLALFAPEHDFDRATQLFNRQVAQPLRDGHGFKPVPVGQRQKFKLQSFLAENAMKDDLARILCGDIPGGEPSLLFSGGHGMAFDSKDARQPDAQGAPVCSDWDRTGNITEEHWFAASDVPANAKVHGLIHFMFACYGGGMPEFDNFDRLNKQPVRITARPFLSKLPRALLTHQNGGALAMLAHVERAWAYSFQSDKGASQIQGFRDVLGRLLNGDRIGQATDAFNMRWAVFSTRLSELQLDILHGADVSLKLLGQFWVARDDARNYMILGDPAVRLRVKEMPEIA
jgi:hypothetical protein